MYRGRIVGDMAADATLPGGGRPLHGRPPRAPSRRQVPHERSSRATVSLSRRALLAWLRARASGPLFAIAIAVLRRRTAGPGARPQSVRGLWRADLTGSLDRLAQYSVTLQMTTPLIFTGLAVSIAFRAGHLEHRRRGADAGRRARRPASSARRCRCRPCLIVPLALIAALAGGAAVGGDSGAACASISTSTSSWSA